MRETQSGYHSVLPQLAQDRLREAAAKARALAEDSLRRRMMIDEAVRVVRTMWPRFFKEVLV